MWIEPLDSAACSLSRAGGKGAHLAALRRAGFPVPGGFVVTTDAYRSFVDAAGLREWIVAAAERVAPADPATLDAAAAAIRDRFAATALPEEIRGAVQHAYQALGAPAVAVRSSATAEDLPDLSFAGQQETFLNVTSEPALLDALVRCWSSLWTARAIGYRARNRIAQSDIAIAVVVQRMVASECSGVLFTADPVTGRRSVTTIEAVFGLGEALVSGRVEPDRYTVVMPGGVVTARTLGSKRLALRPRREGGLEPHDEHAAAMQALPDARIVELARLAARAAALLEAPQDVEWAFAEGQLWLLQSRPITSLYPLPDGLPLEPTQVLVSIGAVQGMLDPLTPLGQDVLRIGLAGAMMRRFGLHADPADGPIVVAGGRLFANVTPIVRHRTLRRGIAEALRLVEPLTRDIVARLLDDPRLVPVPWRSRYSIAWRIGRVVIRVPFNVVLNLLSPDARRKRLTARAEAAVAELEAARQHVTSIGDALALFDRGLDALPRVLMPYLASGVGAGIGMLRLLHWVARDVPEGETLVLQATRGLPHNVTTEMDLALWRAARDGSNEALAAFLGRFGMRGVAEIDIGRPRWRDDPAQLLDVVRSYGQLPLDQAPDAVFARGAANAETALRQLYAELARARGAWWRVRVARFAGRRMRALAGLRESPKFLVIRVLGVIRDALASTAGPDVFFLHLGEVRALAAGESIDFSAAIAERRAVYERELRRRRIPRVLLSDGEAFYGDEARAVAGDAEVLNGSGVSPGVVEGAVRIVFDPHAARLAPGEILVCPGTDPAWTPLFLAAGGLVMEVGGLLTHGSVVAREYGIPAVAGVHGATQRLRTGQRVRVDGSSGRVTLLA